MVKKLIVGIKIVFMETPCTLWKIIIRRLGMGLAYAVLLCMLTPGCTTTDQNTQTRTGTGTDISEFPLPMILAPGVDSKSYLLEENLPISVKNRKGWMIFRSSNSPPINLVVGLEDYPSNTLSLQYEIQYMPVLQSRGGSFSNDPRRQWETRRVDVPAGHVIGFNMESGSGGHGDRKIYEFEVTEEGRLTIDTSMISLVYFDEKRTDYYKIEVYSKMKFILCRYSSNLQDINPKPVEYTMPFDGVKLAKNDWERIVVNANTQSRQRAEGLAEQILSFESDYPITRDGLDGYKAAVNALKTPFMLRPELDVINNAISAKTDAYNEDQKRLAAERLKAATTIDDLAKAGTYLVYSQGLQSFCSIGIMPEGKAIIVLLDKSPFEVKLARWQKNTANDSFTVYETSSVYAYYGRLGDSLFRIEKASNDYQAFEVSGRSSRPREVIYNGNKFGQNWIIPITRSSTKAVRFLDERRAEMESTAGIKTVVNYSLDNDTIVFFNSTNDKESAPYYVVGSLFLVQSEFPFEVFMFMGTP
jgi:hypothetical protein